MLPPSATITVLGFGTAGHMLGAALARRGCAVRAYDLLLEESATRAAMQQRIEDAGVDPAFTLTSALRGAKLIINTATAAASQELTRDASPLLAAGQIFLDITSTPLGTRLSNATMIEARGASYVEAVVAAPLNRLATPMLLAGARANELSPALNALGFATSTALDKISAERSACNSRAELPNRSVRRGELP
jgi:3-hydroxyisobutyrate dehydrogenase-like beta-hydroxyacid dehydrogenase